MDYKKYLRSHHWLDLRAAKLHEVNDQCERCRRRSNLQVHHATYKRLGAEKLTDLVVLCERCHEKEHMLFPVVNCDAFIPKKKPRKPQFTREREDGNHPLFKYVKPLVDGKFNR